MASAFNLTAEINLRGPSNLSKVVSDIRRQLSTVTLDLNINPRALSSIQQATGHIQSLNAVLRSASTNAAALNTALSNLGTAIGNASRGMNNLGGGINNLNNQMNATRRNTAQATSQMEDFGRQSALAIRRFAAFSVATGGIYALSRAITSAYGEFLSFNKELVKLQQVTGATANGLQGITNEITRLSTSLGVTSSDLLTVSSTLAQAGLTATQTKTALEALAKSALAPSFDNLNDTVEGSIALMRQFGISASDLESSLGSVNAVAAAFAVESGDIIKAIQRTGGVFAAASKGVSEGKDALNEFIALFTSVRQTTRESAETIATGLRTIFTRIQRGSTIQALKEYGVVLTDLEGKFVGPYEAIRRLSEGLKLLDPRDLRFNQIVEELGGFRQIGKVIPLIQQFTVAQQALGVAQRGAGSLAEDAAIAQLSLANKITKVREEFIALIRDIGQSKNFQRFVDISLQLASALISVASAAKDVLPALAALAAIKAIPAISQFVGGFGRGFTRRNQGGPIKAFASGGYVPGSGNRDTVPAMLTPGEFVIRKNAVKSIGVQRLQRMNKYASGGPVRLKDLEARSGSSTIKKAYNEKIQPADKISATINRKSQEVKPNDPKWMSVQNFAKSRYAQLRKQNPRASDKKLKDIAAGDAFEESVAKSTGGQRTPQSYPIDIIGKKNAIETKFTTKKTPIIDLISKLFRHRYEQNSLGKYGFTPGLDSVNIGSLDVMEMGSGQKKQFMKSYPFNMGGIVQRFSKGKGVKKVPMEDKISSGMIKNGTYHFGLVGLQSGTGKPIRDVVDITDKESQTFSRGKSKKDGGAGIKKYNVKLHRSTFFPGIGSKDEKNTIEDNIKELFTTMVENTRDMLATRLKSGKNSNAATMNKILSGSPLTSIVGTVFESALASLGSPYVGKTEKTKSMDFPLGLGGIAQDFGIRGDIPTDATRTIDGSGKGLYDMKGQIGRFIGAVEDKEFSKGFAAKFQGSQDIPRDQIQAGLQAAIQRNTAEVLAASISKDMQTDPTLISKAPTGPKGDKLIASVTPKQLANAAKTGKMETLLKKLPSWIIRKHFLMQASGGAISDTVPALLTPGEFVINKKAAKRIGSAKLNKLNKADKISGFNKGGAVGNIQSFVAGGSVSGAGQIFNNLISSITKLIPVFNKLGSTITAVTQNSAAQKVASLRAQGLSGAALKAAMISSGFGPGGINNMRTRNQNTTRRNQAANNDDNRGGGLGLGLMFIGPMVAEAINSSITKNFGKGGAVAGSVISSTISGAAIGSAIPGLGPFGPLIGASAGLAAGFLDAESAANEYTKAQNELTIENQASQLDKAFEKLANKTNITAADLENLGSSINSIISLTNQNQKIVEEEAGGGFFGDISRYLSRTVGAGLVDRVIGTNIGETGTGLDTMKLSRDILSNIRPSVSYLEKTMSTGFQQGLTLDEIRQTTKIGKEEISGFSGEDGVTKLTEFDRLLTMSSDKALELAKIEADIADLRSKQEGAVSQEEANIFDQAAITLEKNRAALIRSTAQAQKEEYNIRLKSAQAIKAVTVEIDMFAQHIKKLEAAVNRAGAQFDEASRIRDITTSAGLGEAKIVGPSRLDENVLSNMTAYSTEELIKALDRTSQTLGFSPEFSKQIKTNAVAQQTLESELPRILLEAAQSQKTPGGELDEPIKKKIEEVFDPLKAALGDQIDSTKLDDALGKVRAALEKNATSLQGKSYEEIVASVPEFQGLLKPLADTTQVVEGSLKAYNDMLNTTTNDMNAFTNHLGRILDLQMQASNIELEAANNLQQALGKGVSVAELNRPFETMIDTLTSTQGPRGLVPGTGTLDPKEIGRRLEQADKELAKAPAGPRKNETLDDFYSRIAKNKNTVDRLAKAQEMLANNTTRASNALNRISELRQAQESRRGTLDEILKNLNNPEWMMDFIGQVGSFVRVEKGIGTIRDIGPAMDAFKTRIAGMDPLERDAATEKFYNNIAKILEKSGFDPEAVKAAFKIAGIGGPDERMNQAMDDLNNAVRDQKEATEQLADRMKNSSSIFYDKVIQAAEDFLKRISEAGDLPPQLRPGGFGVDNNPVGAGLASTGGLIYANKGRLVNFQPRGTDTVPAMLSPGEFVVNARATKNNIGLLKAINNGAGGYSKGGVVYLADGGVIDMKKGKALFSKFLTSTTGGKDKYYADLLASASQSDLDTIFKDLRATSERPLGYESLIPEDIPSADAAINEFINNYEFGRKQKASAELEKIKETRAADAPRLAQLQAQEIQKALSAGIIKDSDLGITNGDPTTASRPLTADERSRLRQAQIDAIFAQREKERKQEFEGRFAEIEKTKRQIEAVKQSDVQARKEINPYTNKPYENMGQKEGVLARQQFEAQQKIAAEAKAKEAFDKKQKAMAGAEIFGGSLVNMYRGSSYYNQTSDPILRETIENRIAEKAASLDMGASSGVLMARIGDIVSSATVEYNRRGRARREMVAKSKEDFAKKNMQTALQQFGEGVDKSPILALATAVPKNVANVIRTVVGGAGVAAGGLTYGAGKLFGSDFIKELGKGLMESGGAQAGMGIEGIRQVGAGLGSRLGFGKAYDTAEQQAIKQREKLISQEVAKVSGAYETNKRTTAGQLFTPENVVRAAITAGDIFGEAAGDIGGEKLFGRLFPVAFKGLAKGQTAKKIQETGFSADILGRTPGMKFPQGSYTDIASRTTYGRGARFAENVKNIKANMADDPLARLATQKGFKGGAARFTLGAADWIEQRFKGIIARPAIAVGRSIMNPRKTLTSVGRGISFGSDVIDQALMKAQSTAMNLAGTTLKKTMDLGGMGIRGGMRGVRGVMNNSLFKFGKSPILNSLRKRLGLETDFYKLQQAKTKKAQIKAQRAAKKSIPQRPQQPRPKPDNITKPEPDPDLIENINSDDLPDAEDIIDNETQPLDLSDFISRTTTAIPKIKVTGTSSPRVIAKIQDAVTEARKKAASIFSRYASSPKKAKEIMEKQDEIFGLRGGVDIDPNLKSKVNVVSKKTGGVGGEYRPTDEQIGIISAEDYTKKGVFLHEILHASQRNIGRMQGGPDIYKFLRRDSLKELQPQIDEFLKPGGAYQKLVKDLGGSLKDVGFYSAEDIAKNHFELLTNLGQAEHTKAFKKNKEAQDMLRAIIKAMGYNKGGIVYASKGTLVPYQSKGTDTVPAMLTPGEFVVNAKATKKNMGLLKAINGGAKGYSKGGVAYLQEGGTVEDLEKKVQEAKNQQETIRQEMLADKETFFYWALSSKGGDITQSSSTMDIYKDNKLQNPRTDLPSSKAWFESDRKGRNKIGEYDYSPEGAIRQDKQNMPITYNIGHEYLANLMGRTKWDQLSANDQDSQITDVMQSFDSMWAALQEASINESKEAPGGWGIDWWQTKMYEAGEQAALQKMRDAQTRIDAIETQIQKDEQEILRLKNPQKDPKVEAKNEAQAQQVEQKDVKPANIGVQPILPEPATTALETVQTNINSLLNAQIAADAIIARDMLVSGLDDLHKQNFNVDRDPIRDIINASEDTILQARTNQLAALQNFYDTNVLPALGDLRPQAPVDIKPKAAPQQPAEDPNAGMTVNEIYKAKKQEMREAYKTNKQSQREAFRTATGRDPKTGNIGGVNKPLTDQEKADNKIRAEIRATKAALGGKKPKDLTEEENLRLQKAKLGDQILISDEQMDNRQRAERLALEAIDPKQRTEDQRVRFFAGHLWADYSPEQMANRQRAERLALGAIHPKNRTEDQQERYDRNKEEWIQSLSAEQMANRQRAERLALGAIDPKQRTEDQQQRYEANRSEFLANLSPDQIANRERAERMALDAIHPDNRSVEQQERLDILKTAIGQRTPEQIARLEELRKEKEKAIYASKGRLINFQPRGSDTVPAMLTPGEFVVNRKATKQNLGLLQQINSQKYNSGGIVKPKYLADGSNGGVQMSSSGGSLGGVLSIDTGDLDNSVSSFDSAIGQLSGSIKEFISGGSSIINAFSGLDNVVSGFTALAAAASLLSGTSTGLTSSIGLFNTAVSQLQSALGKIPDSINLNVTGSIPVNVTVTVNGGQGLSDKLSDFADEIYNTISTELSNKTNGGIKLDLRTSKK